jgi:general secretion pathway protein D
MILYRRGNFSSQKARWIRTALASALLLTVCSAPAFADKAKTLYNKGRDAESRQQYEQAYEYFKQAYDLKPRMVSYRVSYERTRFLAAASHVHQGQLLRDAGKLQEAMAEFQKAGQIDPSNFLAVQESRRTKEMMDEAAQPGAPPAPPDQVSDRLSRAQGPAELSGFAGDTPVTLNMSEDSKIIYQTIGQLGGMNVLFDPDYQGQSRRISVKLNNVTLREALEVVALQSRTFWRPVTSNTIFVAADTTTKRNELSQQVLKTFYLSNLSAPTELQDVVNGLRTILEFQRVQPIPSLAAVVVRGTPDQIALAEKFIDDIDKAKPEVVVDVIVMQVRRDLERNLGIQPPTSVSVALQGNTTSSTTNNNGQVTTTPTTGNNGGINLNKFSGLRATDFVVTLPQATANFLLTDAHTRVLENPQIRASNGAKASLKIGDKIPIATGSFQPGIGGVGINPLVNTQFNYQDVGVNVDITPTVHLDREITLKLTLEISAVTGNSNIGGINQPIIGQRKIDHEIRLKDGEVNLLGGIFEEQELKTMSGIPGLSQLPFFKYLFGSDDNKRTDNEIVFILIPHILRGPDLTPFNQRAIDVGMGTQGGVWLREGPRTRPVSATGAAAAPTAASPAATQTPGSAIPGMQPPTTAPAAPPVTPPAMAPGETAPQPQTSVAQPAAQVSMARLGLDPPALSATAGSTFAVNVIVSGAQNVASLPLQITFDPSKLQLVNVSNGSFLARDGQAPVLTHREMPDSGTAQMTASRPPSAPGISGDGPVFTLTFMAKAPGISNLVINRTSARDPSGQPLPMAGSQSVVTIK